MRRDSVEQTSGTSVQQAAPGWKSITSTGMLTGRRKSPRRIQRQRRSLALKGAGGTGMFLLPVIKKVTQRVVVTIFSMLEILGLPPIEDKKDNNKEAGA
jgi:hypothetical protein